MHVRLTRKLAERLDGIDLAGYGEGDVLDLGRREAELLIAEGWATAVDDARQMRRSTVPERGVNAADDAGQTSESVERMRADMRPANSESRAYRPIEERVRGESHDEGPRNFRSRHQRRK